MLELILGVLTASILFLMLFVNGTMKETERVADALERIAATMESEPKDV